jgi:hypothetical protein
MGFKKNEEKNSKERRKRRGKSGGNSTHPSNLLIERRLNESFCIHDEKKSLNIEE